MPDWRFIRNVLIKTALLLLALNLLFAALNPLGVFGRLSGYNELFPGRPRLPFGERPDVAFNFSLYSLDAMFASHAIQRAPAADEFRLVLVGDSSVWGTLRKPEETLAGQINALGLTTSNGRRVVAYNLGYPTISLTKDLLLIERIRATRPDMIVWLTTLEAFPKTKQLASPIVQNNAAELRPLIARYGLSIDPNDPALVNPGLWGRTIFGQRRALADLARLQLYGIPWAATGIDQYYPDSYEPRANDLEADPAFYELKPPALNPDDLALDVLRAGMQSASNNGALPVLLVNEPMFVADGANSDIRYNFFYPRWAYDDYRRLLQTEAERAGWHYADLWNAVDNSQYTNSAIHLTAAGEAQLAARLQSEILKIANATP